MPLEDIINEYFRQEHINDFKCDKCKKTGEIVKTQEILAFPKVLVVNVKRFVYYPQPKKLDNKVELQDHIALHSHYTDGHHDLRDEALSFFSKEKAKGNYNLICCIEHYGRLNCGHYIASCYDSNKKRWIRFNDDNVSESKSLAELGSSGAAVYVMFYEQSN